jgi:hypothetical protein
MFVSLRSFVFACQLRLMFVLYHSPVLASSGKKNAGQAKKTKKKKLPARERAKVVTRLGTSYEEDHTEWSTRY